MADKYRIAIVGAGPGGLSAAAHAAGLGVSHVLLETAPHIANTVHRFQKRKLVMAEPAQLPLHSGVSFAAGTRESILEAWRTELATLGVNLRTGATVQALTGIEGNFRLALSGGDCVEAESVVLAIGLQGNLRRLNVPGDDLPGVQYHLDDPDEFADETIVVVGGGDAGVENALALASRNRVILINRQEEFTNCREANYRQLREAEAAGRIETRLATRSVRIEASAGVFALALVVQSPRGQERIECRRIIVRIGALPPREMLERFGIRFPSEEPTAVPQLSERYESNVSELYVIGALAGYPLIKQALNQGREVVDYILRRPVERADEPLLREKFSRMPGELSVVEGIELMRLTQPLLASLTTLQMREFMLDSDVLAPVSGTVIFRRNDYGNSFFSILQGGVQIRIERPGQSTVILSLTTGDFFGELGLLSGRRRSATVVAGEGCVLVETPRRSMLKLLDQSPVVQRHLDEVALKRIVRNCFGGSLPDAHIDEMVQVTQTRTYAVGDVLFHEGDEADGLYMIRRGSVTASRMVNGREVIAAYIAAGDYVGEMALVSRSPRTATVRAAAPTEAVVLAAERFAALLERNPGARSEVAARYFEGVRSREAAVSGRNSQLIQFLMEQGAGEATDVLLIDYARCIRCDNCERACAEAHEGTSRLRRAAGRTCENVHVPASCRHCEQPRCMKDCPPDAIHRAPGGEVYITEACIGCGNCLASCPYGVIQLVSPKTVPRLGLLNLILGRTPTDPARPAGHDGDKRAAKCDHCMHLIGGAACVRACPTGAAFWARPDEFVALHGQ